MKIVREYLANFFPINLLVVLNTLICAWVNSKDCHTSVRISVSCGEVKE